MSRDEFIESVHYDGKLPDNYIQNNPKREPSSGDLVEGYKKFIQDLGNEFFKIVETYIKCISIAKNNELIGNTQLKARIKDFSSCYTNTDTKLLDDVFGIEIVTATEREKEFFMLFNHLIFNIINDKKYNKHSGYRAYHCTGDLKTDIKLSEDSIEQIVNDILKKARTREYRYTKHETNYKDGLMNNIFNNIPDKEKNPTEYKRMIKALLQMIQIINQLDINKSGTPIIEFHFLTSEVEQEAIRGKDSHSNYKKTNEKLIKQFFRDGRLFRGINSPWKFEVIDNKLVLQDFYKTLIENWPFLIDDIVKKRDQGTEIIDRENNYKFDKLLSVQFPFLCNYLEGDIGPYSERQKNEMWGVLKSIIISNSIYLNGKMGSLSENFIKMVPEIW